MAKQKSIVQFSGTIDGINFYFRKGVAVARKAGGGFTGAAIKKSPSMERVRENNSEFGRCSRFKKVFKDALFVYFKNYKHADLHGKLMRLFLAIKDYDLISARGSRTLKNGLMNTAGLNLLLSFRFTDFSLSMLNGIFNPTDYSYALQGFAVSSVRFPLGATHLCIDYGVMKVDFDLPHAKVIESTTSVLLSPDATFNGAHFLIDSDLVADATIGFLRYRFVQVVNGVAYSFNDQAYFGLQVVGIS